MPSDPCPIGCTCDADPDQNVSTAYISRDFGVAGACVEGTSTVIANSMRAVKDALDPTLTEVSLSGAAATDFNLHGTSYKDRLAEPTIRNNVPIISTGPSPITIGLTDCPGAQFLAAFERDLCPSGRSLPDP